MVNYLWPSLTILFAILFNGQKSSWLVIPGLILALLGVGWVLGGEHGLQPDEIISNVISSPLSYLLAFVRGVYLGRLLHGDGQICPR